MSPAVYAWISRHSMNLWPCIRRTGGRVTHLSPDFMTLIVRLPLNWKTRNIVGTIFGGSIYASTDPFFMIMLMRILGKDFVVWDKGCTIRFKKPAKETIYARFEITPEMLSKVREDVALDGKTVFTWTIQYRDAAGTVYAEFDKLMYVAKKEVYKARGS